MPSGLRPVSLLAAATLAALVLRFPIASHDVEHYVGPDEGEVVENVLEMMKTGDLDHRHPGYPGLHFYLQMVPATGYLLASRVAGKGGSIPELPRSGFYLQARRLTLLFGIAVAPVAFWCGRSFLAPWASALACGLVAFSPLAFRESAVVNPDLTLSFFVALGLGLALRLLRARSTSSFLTAGAAVGLAAAVKYTGGLALFPYALGWLLGPEPRRNAPKALAGAAAAAAAFAVASPYTLLKLDAFFDGLSMHVGYYSAADRNGAWELVRALVPRGLGVAGSLAAVVGLVRAVTALEPRRLVVLAYPALYFVLFAFFDRAYPRHALVLLPHAALFAADASERIALVPRFVRSRVALAGALGVGLLVGPVLASVDLARRNARATPAERAAAWVASELPEGSRVLQDQYTPQLDPARFLVRRLGVEEKVFVGNYDWVLYSGYPPGISTEGLREVQRFEREQALGDGVTVFQVPDRESLMGVSLSDGASSLRIGAGELPYFGDGWSDAIPGAFETSRLSSGPSSEIFFVLESRPEGALEGELVLGVATGELAPRVSIALNASPLETVELGFEERQAFELRMPGELFAAGLNRLTLVYPETVRLDRRHRETAVRFFKLELRRGD